MSDDRQNLSTVERTLLTDREREILANQADVSDNYRYKVRSVVRKRIRQAAADIKVLRENHSDLFEELQAVVCEGDERDE